MTTTTHQVRLQPVGVFSRFGCHWEPGDVFLMSRSSLSNLPPRRENLQSSVSSNPCKATTRRRQRNIFPLSKCCQNSERNPWEPSEATERGGNKKKDAVGGSHFHGYANYTIFEPMVEDVNGSIDSLHGVGRTPARDACGEFFRSQKDAPNVEIRSAEDASFLM